MTTNIIVRLVKSTKTTGIVVKYLGVVSEEYALVDREDALVFSDIDEEKAIEKAMAEVDKAHESEESSLANLKGNNYNISYLPIA